MGQLYYTCDHIRKICFILFEEACLVLYYRRQCSSLSPGADCRQDPGRISIPLVACGSDHPHRDSPLQLPLRTTNAVYSRPRKGGLPKRRSALKEASFCK